MGRVNILCIGGTGFIGTFVIPHLQRAGHSVTVFHRGSSGAPGGVETILGDRNSLDQFRHIFQVKKFDVVVDFVLSSERQAKQLMAALEGITGRVIALSSMDAYRAWGVYYGLEPGGLDPLPITEGSAVRTKPPYPPENLKRFQQLLAWVDDDYDKVRVEKVILGSKELPGTVIRLPMIYGPGDYLHRFYPLLKRMDDGRRHILFADNVAHFRTPRGYVEDVAAGITLAITKEAAAGRIYNICESESFTELKWAQKIADAVGWRGEFVVLPPDRTPAHLRWPYNTEQQMVVSSARIRGELGYREVVPEKEAFQRTIAWERANPPQQPMIPFDYEAEDAAIAQLAADFRR
jgi:nucleoside-diphosphate-sugar epimerase